ncbi:16S rRNA (guanine(966)-N(2))-methyltransferase RsmD [Thermodesulfobacteriota bacterium]
MYQGVGLRIIGGDLRGKKLHSIRGAKIRPTADRLRESIFNILGLRVRDTVVLDLFAGTGALGLEALSRGADSAVFIENDKGALSLIERNIRSCNFNDKARTIKWDIKKNLNCIKSTSPTFDLVFMDPPYNGKAIRPALLNLQRSGALEEDALIIVEHSPLEAIPEDILELTVVDQRRYGKALVSFLNYVV